LVRSSNDLGRSGGVTTMQSNVSADGAVTLRPYT